MFPVSGSKKQIKSSLKLYYLSETEIFDIRHLLSYNQALLLRKGHKNSVWRTIQELSCRRLII